MKRWFFLLVAIALVVGFGIQTQAFAEPRIAVKPMANLSKNETISIYGTGFAPGKEIKILYTDPQGITADLESYLDPKPSIRNELRHRPSDGRGQKPLVDALWLSVFSPIRYKR